MYRNDRLSLAPWIQDAYERVAAEIRHRDSGLPPDHAQDCLQIDNEEDAQYALMRLLDRGYLYQVDDELFVTEPEPEPDDGSSRE